MGGGVGGAGVPASSRAAAAARWRGAVAAAGLSGWEGRAKPPTHSTHT